MRGPWIAAAMAAGLSGCVLIVDDDGAKMNFGGDIDYPPPKALYAAELADNHLTVRVKSNGCTTKGDFEAHVKKKRNMWRVELDRMRKDVCKRSVPEGVELSYSFAELGLPDGAAVKIVNPIKDAD